MVDIGGGNKWVVLKNSLAFWGDMVCYESILLCIHSFSQHLLILCFTGQILVVVPYWVGPGGTE